MQPSLGLHILKYKNQLKIKETNDILHLQIKFRITFDLNFSLLSDSQSIDELITK